MEAARILVSIGADSSDLTRGMQQAQRSMRSVGQSMTSMGRGMTLGVTAPLVGLGIAAIKIGAQYDKTMNVLQAATRATDEQMGGLRKTAISLGADMTLPGTSAKDAGEAMLELAKGGLSVDQTMQAAKGTLQLAAAAGIENADAARIQVRALNAFNMEGKRAAEVANLIAAAANASTADAGDIALGFQQAAAGFSAAGYEARDLAASLAIMTDKGIAGSDAGTSLKTMMMRLNPQTRKAKKAMAELGVETFDAQGKMKPLRSIIGDMSNALGELTPKQRDAALQVIFGSDAMRAANYVLGGGVAAYDKYNRAVGDQSAASRMAAAQMKGLSGAWEQIKGQAETAAIVLTGRFQPALEAIGNGLAKLIAGFTGLSGSTQNMIVGLALLAAAIGPVMMTLGGVVLVLSMLASPVLLVAAAVVALGAAFIILGTKSETFRDILGTLKSVVTGSMSPMDGLRTVLQRLGMSAGDAAKVAEKAAEVWRAVSSTIKAAVIAVASYAIEKYREIASAISKHSAEIKATIAAAWAIISSITKAVWPVIATTVKAAWAVIKAVIDMNLKVIGNLIRAVMAVIRGDWSTAWEALKAAAKAAVTGLVNIIRVALTGLAQIAWSLMVNVGKQIVQGVLAGVGGLGSALKNKVEGMLKGALSSLNPFSPVAHGGETYIGRPIAEGAIRGWLLGSAELPTKLNERIRAAVEAGRAQVQASTGLFTSAWQQLAADAMTAFDARTDSMMGRLKGKLESHLAQIDAALKRKLGGITAFREELTAAEKALSDLEAAQQSASLSRGVSDAQAQLGVAGTPEERAAAERQLADAQYAVQVAALRQQAELERTERDKMAAQREAAATATAEKQKLAAEKASAAKALELTAARNLEKRHLEQSLAQLDAHLQKHPEKWQAVHKKVMTLFKDEFGPGYKTAGQNLGKAFAQGLRESMGDVRAAVTDLAEVIARNLKTHSPTKEGPLSSLDSWWTGFAPALVSGLDTGAVRGAVAGMVTRPSLPAGVGSGAVAGAGGRFGGGGGTVVYEENHFHIAGHVLTESKLLEIVRNAAIKEGRRSGGNLLGGFA